MKNFHYTKSSKKSVSEALKIVQETSEQEGFGVLHIHDIKETMKGKGYDIPPAYIVEICDPKLVHKLIVDDPLVLLFLPCKVAIFTEADQTVVSALMPPVAEHYMPGLDFREFHPAAEQALKKIVEAAL